MLHSAPALRLSETAVFAIKTSVAAFHHSS
jgi:hypothetical protein